MILKNLFVLLLFSVLIVPFGLSQEEAFDIPEEIAPAPNDSAVEEELAVLEKASGSSEGGDTIKIIIVSLLIIILAAVAFFIFRNINNSPESTAPATEPAQVVAQ